MKKMLIAVLFCVLLISLVSATNNATDKNNLNQIKQEGSAFFNNVSKNNHWNETVIISPTWQKIIGGFFGLNLHKESTEISVNEAIVYFMVFVLFFTLIIDIINLIPFFNSKFAKFFASLAITSLVSITGAFINLKNLFVAGINHTITSLDWEWLNYLTQHRILGIIVTIFVIIPVIFIIHEIISWGGPLIKKYSQVSRAEAKGRLISETIKSEDKI